MKMLYKIFAGVLFSSILLNSYVFGYGNSINLYWEEPTAEINQNVVQLNVGPLRYQRNTFVPVDDMLKACNYTLGWDFDLNAVTAYKDGVISYIISNSPVLWKGPQQYIASANTIIYNDTFYMPLDMFTFLTDDTVTVIDREAEDKYLKRDLLIDTKVSQHRRIYGEIFRYNNVSVVGNYGMMTEYPTNTMIDSYVKAVNLIGNTAPVGVNVYNILVPTSGEFYGPQGVYLDQTSFIRTAYNNLSERIIPINAVSSLDKHADEYIYFRTDHHWTQRGAYYAYKEFMQVKGEEVPMLADFEVVSGTFVGSLAEFTKGTYGEQVLRAHPDIIEKFIPFHYTNGAAYKDMYMTQHLSHLYAVYPNVNSYLAYIGGDTPMAVFTSDINNGKKLLILKESFGNAFATWALNNYSEVYVVDVRNFNKNENEFNLSKFYNFVQYDDIVIINSISSLGISEDLQRLVY